MSTVSDFLSDLATLPETVQAHIAPALGLEQIEASADLPVRAHYLELSESLATVYVCTPGALIRVQVAPAGACQRTVVPINKLARIDELAEAGNLTVVLELEADNRTLQGLAGPGEGRWEFAGQILAAGWAITATPERAQALSAFVTAVRATLIGRR